MTSRRTPALSLLLCCCLFGGALSADSGPEVGFAGNRFRTGRQLRKVMRLKWPGGRFDRDTLLAGLARLEEFYRRQGFTDVSAAHQLRVDSAHAAIAVDVTVAEGDRYLVSAVGFTGNVRLADTALRRAVRTRPGAPYDPAMLGQDDFTLMLYYADFGMIYAEAGHRVEIGADRSVRVMFRINEGDLVRIGRIGVEGNRTVRSTAVLRELTIAGGDLFSSSELSKSRAQLMATDLFRGVDIEPGSLQPDGRLIDLAVRVRERPRRRFETGFGYGSGDAFRVTTRWMDRNRDGSGGSVELSGQVAFQLWSRVKLVRGLAQAGMRLPWTMGKRWPAQARAYYDDIRPAYTDYRLQTVGGLVRSDRSIGRYASLATTWRQEWLKLSPGWSGQERYADTMGYRGHRAVAVLAGYERTLDPVNPVRGLRGELETEYSGGLLGGIDTYQRLNLTATMLAGSADRPVALAARVRLGIIGDWSRRHAVPVYQKYVLGGPTSLRGFALGRVGPLDAAGRPLGGDKMAMVNLECRLRAHRNWRLVLFGDAGFVSNSSFAAVSLSEAVGSPGCGVRYLPPFGAARLDLAAPWSRVGRIRDWRVIVAWGEAF